MKHLKIFENIGNYFWLVTYNIKDGDTNYWLYPDKESAEIHVITIVNQERRDFEQNNYSDDMFFSEIDDAMDWYEDTFSDITINYQKLILSKHLEGSKKLQRMRDIKKYNL